MTVEKTGAADSAKVSSNNLKELSRLHKAKGKLNKLIHKTGSLLNRVMNPARDSNVTINGEMRYQSLPSAIGGDSNRAPVLSLRELNDNRLTVSALDEALTVLGYPRDKGVTNADQGGYESVAGRLARFQNEKMGASVDAAHSQVGKNTITAILNELNIKAHQPKHY